MTTTDEGVLAVCSTLQLHEGHRGTSSADYTMLLGLTDGSEVQLLVENEYPQPPRLSKPAEPTQALEAYLCLQS